MSQAPRFIFRCADADWTEILRLAKFAGKSVNVYLRDCALGPPGTRVTPWAEIRREALGKRAKR